MTATAPRTRATQTAAPDFDAFANPPATPQLEAVPQEDETEHTFDPARHLITLGRGEKYLAVKWRLLWLRTDHPDARIETEMVQVTNSSALFKARVALNNGACATGYGSETASDFGDFIEKAETKALGRALAALGYGTQFTQDFDYDTTGERVVDSPIETQPRGFGGVAAPTNAVTDKQLKAIFAIGRETLGLSDDEIDARCNAMFHCTPEQLTKADASRFIDTLKREAA